MEGVFMVVVDDVDDVADVADGDGADGGGAVSVAMAVVVVVVEAGCVALCLLGSDRVGSGPVRKKSVLKHMTQNLKFYT